MNGTRAAQWLYPANVLTELRIAAIPAIAACVLTRHLGWAFWLLFAAGVSDGFDGYLARRLHQQSRLGAWLDPLADKGLLATLFVVLAIAGDMPWWLTILVFVRDLCILSAALVLFLFTHFRNFQPTWWGKACTTASLLTIGATLWEAATPHAALLWLEHFGWVCVTGFSLFSGIHYSFASAGRYRATRHDAAAS